ncbi:general transcription factor IIF subunit 1-like [Helianthus annuus]|uniref:general transcription factor IIF subunit 1-like n=1 Tax=Helianthus annuus TaxID=4232 RepID=UPI000B8F94B5|nr:general transcription factor IIF subunit 1-like [Helianthus annuus]
MDNESLKQLARYHPNHPEPSSKVEFFGFKDKSYQDPDPINHQNWRNEKEMKEKSYADELKVIKDFKESRNKWFLKEEKKKRSRKATPKIQVEEGSSSQPKRKRQKKTVETMLVDDSDKADEAEAEVNVQGDVHLSPDSAKLLKDLTKDFTTEKTAGDEEGDDVDKSSSSSSDEEIDEIERAKRIKAEIEKEKQLKRNRKEDKDIKHQPSPIHSPLHQSPPHQPSPIQSPPHLSPPHQTPIQEQPLVTSQQIFQTPPSTQPPVQTTPGSSGYKTFPNIPEGITLEEIGDFGFANDERVKRLEKKVEEVLIENKKLVDREKKLEKRVKSVEAENSSLLKKVEADQTEIDILKVKVAELEEEKARRDEQNKYFELKNKELEAAKAMKEHEIYMMNKVLENMLRKSVEQRFEEIEVEEVRARRQQKLMLR